MNYDLTVCWNWTGKTVQPIGMNCCFPCCGRCLRPCVVGTFSSLYDKRYMCYDFLSGIHSYLWYHAGLHSILIVNAPCTSKFKSIRNGSHTSYSKYWYVTNHQITVNRFSYKYSSTPYIKSKEQLLHSNLFASACANASRFMLYCICIFYFRRQHRQIVVLGRRWIIPIDTRIMMISGWVYRKMRAIIHWNIERRHHPRKNQIQHSNNPGDHPTTTTIYLDIITLRPPLLHYRCFSHLPRQTKRQRQRSVVGTNKS